VLILLSKRINKREKESIFKKRSRKEKNYNKIQDNQERGD
jgi:hypothetical protein